MRRLGHRWAVGLVVGAAWASFGGAAQAHFYLEAPPAMTEQNNLGDPQKTAPCGDPGNATLTGDVTTFAAGETITITIDERIYHPGHYRVALAVNDPSELPAAPPVTPTMMDDCASTVVQDPPVFPVLADGELVHSSQFDGPQSFQVTLPDDVECDNCTLQIIEYMSQHADPCFYYHCAVIAIEADPGMTSADTGDEGPATSGDGSTSGDASDSSGGASSVSATTADSTASATATDGGTGSGTDTSVDADTSDDEGCGCSTSSSPGHQALALLGLVGLLGVRRRRH